MLTTHIHDTWSIVSGPALCSTTVTSMECNIAIGDKVMLLTGLLFVGTNTLTILHL